MSAKARGLSSFLLSVCGVEGTSYDASAGGVARSELGGLED